MITRPAWPVLVLASILALAQPHSVLAFGNSDVKADQCAVAAGGEAKNNTVTCNFGLTPEQVKQLTEAAVRGATAPLTSTIVELSKRLGVTEDATTTLLRIVGEQDVPLERLSETLQRVATDYRRLQAETAALKPDNATAQGFVAQAKTEIDAGHLARAHELLRQATQAQIAAAQEARKLREQAQAAEDAQMLGAANSTAAEGEVALTEGHYLESAELFGQAASYVPAGHPDESGAYLDRRADAFYRQGDERADNDALRRSAETYRAVLQQMTRERVPLAWARTQKDLGTALAALGDRENNGTARLKEAMAAFRAALQENTRERVPLEWAGTQMNLGVVLWKLGERQGGTARLKEAVAAFSAALQENTRERVPLEWARTQMNLGSTLVRLGELGGGTARLKEAVAAFCAALQANTRERVPLEWARTQMNLGVALEAIGELESGTAWLEEAVTAYQAALQENVRERVPLEWARTQMNLGNALRTLGELEGGTARLKEAVATIRVALQENTRDRVPLNWARTQMNLGNALQTLGEREGGTARLGEAVTAYQAALQENVRERVPLEWAATQMNLGNALQRLGKREGGVGRLEQAVAAYQGAFDVFIAAGADYYAMICLASLGAAEALLVARGQ